MRILRALVVVAPLSIVAGACSAQGDNGQYQSGVDGNAQLNGLSSTQKTTICTSRAKYVHARVDTTSLMRFACAFTPAVFGARTDADCQAAMDSCVNALSVKVDVTLTDPNAPPPECTVVDTSTCTGTVGQYEACVQSLADVQLQIGTDFSCGKRAEYQTSPTVGIDACGKLGPTCTVATGSTQIR
jgi:hypothetical protein